MRVVFLDRDGVINKYPGDRQYVTSLKKFKFLNGSLPAIRELSQAGYALFVVSNQAGVSKGLYSKTTLGRITRHMLQSVAKTDGTIKKVLYCLHTKEAGCSCRKPKDGLLRKAVQGRRVDLKNSYFIGDSIQDVQAGKKFGCKTILVLSGREKLKNASQWEVPPDFIARSLASAAKNILRNRYERA